MQRHSTIYRPQPFTPRLGRPIQLPPFNADERARSEESFPASLVLQIPPISNIVYDIRCPPSTLRSAPASPFNITRHSGLSAPFTPSRPASVRIISKEFPWTFDVHERTRGSGVTCQDIISALYGALQAPLAENEWGFCSDDLRQRIIRAWKRRESQVGRRSGAESSLKRVDLLGSRCKLRGFCRDEAFVARRLFPGTQPLPDTWIVRFMQ
ncbi:hypothetical protein C8R47DRAFT_1037070 [Mycena vitilis]|nr:hypothetical protein C8R47DRAFT_1037070 [Mycena vitilis]